MRIVAGVGLACLALAGCGSQARSGATGTESTPRESQRAAVVATDLAIGWPRTDFSRHTVPLSEFQSGGPGKDGIPALFHPRFSPAGEVDFLGAREPVIVLTVDRQIRAYPLQILLWHEIVNDRVGGVPVAVTYCPLCNTAIAFDRRVAGRTLTFGTTGNLRNSDLVMYDRETESWWQQFGGEGVVGHFAGSRLDLLPSRILAWSDFSRDHPGALVLDRRTGYDRRYGENPYRRYDELDSPPLFGVANEDDRRLSPKERVVFVQRGTESAAIPYSVLGRRRIVRVTVGGHHLVVRWRPGVSSALDKDQVGFGRDVGAANVTENGRPVAFSEPFWFAVAAFRPTVVIPLQ